MLGTRHSWVYVNMILSLPSERRKKALNAKVKNSQHIFMPLLSFFQLMTGLLSRSASQWAESLYHCAGEVCRFR